MSAEDQHGAPIFQYSVKIERTAHGARHTVHVYSHDRETSIAEAVKMYDDVAKKLEEQGLAVAPIEKGLKHER